MTVFFDLESQALIKKLESNWCWESRRDNNCFRINCCDNYRYNLLIYDANTNSPLIKIQSSIYCPPPLLDTGGRTAPSAFV